PAGALEPAADRRHRQGDEGRPAEMPRCRRFGLYRQAGRHRAIARLASRVGHPRPRGPGRSADPAGGRGIGMNRPVREIPLALPTEAEQAAEASAERARVLLVDDDERNLLAAATVLED